MVGPAFQFLLFVSRDRALSCLDRLLIDLGSASQVLGFDLCPLGQVLLVGQIRVFERPLGPESYHLSLDMVVLLLRNFTLPTILGDVAVLVIL